MKLKLVILVVAILGFQSVNGQGKFASSFTLGSSFTPLFNYDGITNENQKVREITWMSNVAIQLLPRWEFGINYLTVYHRSRLFNEAWQKNNYRLVGTFVQFLIASTKTVDFKAEVNYARGDYCLCTNNFPFASRKENLNYIGAAVIGKVKLTPRLHLDTTFYLHKIVTKNINFTTGYNFLSVGLDVVLGKLNEREY